MSSIAVAPSRQALASSPSTKRSWVPDNSQKPKSCSSHRPPPYKSMGYAFFAETEGSVTAGGKSSAPKGHDAGF